MQVHMNNNTATTSACNSETRDQMQQSEMEFTEKCNADANIDEYI